MADDYTLSLSQVAQLLNDEKVEIAESTVRKYAKLYKEFLPSRKQEGVRWEKYPPTCIDIIRRIFTLSESGKNRHEIKEQLKADGYGVTLEGEAVEVNDTATESTQRHNNTPPATHPEHDENTPLLHPQHRQLIADHASFATQNAIDSLMLYRTLVEDKNLQIQEMEAQIERLKREKQTITRKWQTEVLKILQDVTRFKQKSQNTIAVLKRNQY